MYVSIYKSPIGNMKIEAVDQDIVKIKFISKSETSENPNEATLNCKSQLEEYFSGKRKVFDIKYKFIGTDFQKAVWEELAKIPYGKTVSYKYIAERIGRSKAVRAVANAIGKNNLGIVVPCHRVIGSNGKLTGFSAETDERTGIELKQELLNLEGIA